MAELEIRKIRVEVEEIRHHLGHTDDGGPLIRAAACAVIRNPFAGQGHVEDLSSIIDGSAAIGTELGSRCAQALDGQVDSYGKAGIAGTAGEQEHVHAALTSVFGNAFRDAIGGGVAWISSTKKVGAPGATIDVPLAFKDEVWVRSHYDTITVQVPDAPLADELVIIAAVANRGRINARVGGMTREAAVAAQDAS
ncbi:amino acid synthesis family protein [Nitriliruptor alkaliphilus]|uniref:amino acid synthesis family protein n=1 Tax=Nitriliruptor alkaliphilus TaxID=427918 RepID=UPI0006967513|nr:amino acid synthesis family protein [Nitriliruptor alkaliphilus]